MQDDLIRLYHGPWSSLKIREFGDQEHLDMLSHWTIPRTRKWLKFVNRAETETELRALRQSCNRAYPTAEVSG
jgi:hypothetical protein